MGGLCVAAAAAPAWAISFGQFDDFQDLTTQNWRIGIDGLGLPANVPTGGPAGPGDAYLRSTSGGFPPRMVIFNIEQWRGDYLAAGVTSITADVINLGGTTLNLRVAFGDTPDASGGGWFSSTTAFVLEPDSGWQSITFPITEADMTDIYGGPSFDTVMSNVGAMRILSSETPSSRGDVMTAAMGVDNITALPAPGAAALLGVAGAIAMRRRRAG